MARVSEFHLGIATLLFTAGAAALLIAEPFRYRHQSPKSFAIQAAEVNGRVRVDWSPADVRQFKADAAVLRVQDGDTIHEYPIDRKTLQAGGLDYLRKSDDVLLSLTLLGEGKPRTEVMVRTIVSGARPVADPAKPAAQSRARRR